MKSTDPIPFLTQNILSLAALFLVSAAGQAGDSTTISKENWPHRWESINYYPTARKPENLELIFSVNPYSSGLSLQMTIFSNSERPKLKIEANIITENDQVVLPIGGNPIEVGGAVGKGFQDRLQWLYHADFAWGRNEFQAAWIKIKLENTSLLLELPYGFYRNPEEPLPKGNNDGPPKLPSSIMKNFDGLRMLPWQSIRYELGWIHDGKFLSIERRQENRPTWEVILYSEDWLEGKPAPWKKDVTKTSLQIHETSQKPIEADLFNQKVHDDFMRLSHFYRLPETQSTLRTWGKMKIQVDDEEYELTVPSSLYR